MTAREALEGLVAQIEALNCQAAFGEDLSRARSVLAQPEPEDLPEEIVEEIREYARAVENTMGWSAGGGAWTGRKEALTSLESVILKHLRGGR